MKKELVGIIFFCIICFYIFPQTYHFRNYLEKNGLPSPEVYLISQDVKGYLWFGTSNGIACFDGREFKSFNEKDSFFRNKIYGALEDSWGNIWIITRNAATCFSKGKFSNNFRHDYLSKFRIFSILDDGNRRLWLGTSGGLFYFDGTFLHSISPCKTFNSKNIYTIALGEKGYLWLGTEKGVVYFDAKNLTSSAFFSTKEGLLENEITSLCFDSFGRLWIGTIKGLNCVKNGKISYYVGKDSYTFSTPSNLLRFPMKDCLAGTKITSILEDKSHNIWISTTNGVSILSGNEFITLNAKNGLVNNYVNSIFQDREGNIWFSTHDGASCLDNVNVKTYSKDDGLPNNRIYDIIRETGGRFWLGTPEGLCSFQKDQIKNYTLKDGLISNNINKLMQDVSGNIWCATFDGLSIFSSNKFSNYNEKNEFPSNVIFDVIESKDKFIWISSRNGIFCYRNKKFSKPLFNTNGKHFTCIIEGRNGRLWFSTFQDIYCYDNEKFTDISTQYKLPKKPISAILEDGKEKLWICTTEGMICFKNEKYQHFSVNSHAILDNVCNSMVEDNNGFFWICHPKGLTCFDGNNFKTIATYTSERMGLTARSWNRGIKDNQGNLWFATSDGLVTFTPPPILPVKTPPPVYITGLKVMEKPVSIETVHEFPYNRNIFRFNYTGIHFTLPEAVSYKYKLEGLDSEWNITKDRSLFYPFLPPKKYTFKVIAINCDGVESTKPAEYSFIINPPFWNTSWFYLIISLFVGSLLTIFFNWHVKRVKAKTELKELNRQLVTSQRMELMGTLAAGTVHDLKNLMAIIVGYTRMMSQTFHKNKDNNNKVDENPESDENAEYVDIINNTASTAVQMAKQILSFARPKNIDNTPVELDEVLSEILDTLKVSQPKNIKLNWNPSTEPIYFIINPARLQQVVMNLCLNAFDAMPKGGEVTVSLSLQENTHHKKNKSTQKNLKEILVEVADTGKDGIKKEDLKKIFEPLFTTKSHDKGTGLGLFVVKQIVDEYNGHIDVKSEPGTGTTFSIYFPYTDPESF